MSKSRLYMACTAAALLITAALLVGAAPALATTYYVHPSGGGSYTTIQEAINASINGDTVLVADGNYTGVYNRDINYGGRNIVVVSENGPDNCVVNLTGTNGYRGFVFNSGEGPSAVLEGFTIRGGWLDPGSGGGILVSNSSPVIRGNVIKKTVAQGSYVSPGWAYGGGIALYNSNANVINNTVDSCSVQGSWTGGGGIYCSGGMPFISGNTITNNSTAGYGSHGGGGICSRSSSPIITNNFIYNNSTDESASGGGIYCFGNNASADTLRIFNNVVTGNDGPRPASGGEGGGIYTDYSHAHVVNNVIQQNNQDGLHGDAWTVVRNCIFDHNTGLEISPNYLDVAYCWLQGQTYVGGGAGNINGSSITFQSGPLGDYYYDDGHECNNAGNAAAANICFMTVDGLKCMDDLTTSDHQGLDAGRINMGIHYQRVPFTIYVPDHFATIQEAINHALDEDSVCVRAGTYHETITFLGKPIPVYSESGRDVTTIDGDAAGAVVTFNNSEGPNSILEGFTITDGHASSGGGIFCWYTSPTIRNVIVSASVADYDGGGIYISHGSPSIENAVVTGNTAQYGGGLRCTEGSPFIGSSAFTLNQAYHGAGVQFYNSVPIVLETTINENTATGFNGGSGFGAGVYLGGGGGSYSPIIQYCVISNNVAQNTGGGGGGITFGLGVNPTIDHCTFYGNSAEIGAAIRPAGGTATVSNTIIAFNKIGAAVTCETGGTANLGCCDVYNNDGGDWTDCITGQAGTNNNFSSDPLFCDAYNRDFSLSSSSPCSDYVNYTCGLVGAVGAGCAPSTWHVNASGTGDFATIQDAIDGASGGDLIELANGTYTGTGNRDIYYWNKSVIVRSASGNPALCIIDCQASELDTHRGFILNQREGSGAQLDGVTVRNAWSAGGGGGMLIQRSNPVVTNCVFENGRATDGGGIFNSQGADPIINGCTFIGNSATNAGGGLRNSFSDVPVYDCVFIDNWAHWGGGGMYNYYSDGDLAGCVFSGNTCDYWGGALHNDQESPNITITNCTFADNGAPYGGAIYNRRNVTIVVVNSIIANSTAGEAIWCDATCSSVLSCGDVYGNTGGDYVGCLAGQETSYNNFSADPLFCDPGTDHYQIRTDSPCAPGNNPSCGKVGALDVGCSPGPTIIVVDPGGGGNHTTIQAAIDAAFDGDVVELVDATYTGTGNRDLDYRGKAVTVRSQSGNAAACIIDCQGSSGDPHRGFHFDEGEGVGSALSDVTIRSGYATDGGGIYMTGCSPTLSGVVFEDNATNSTGGGMYLTGSSPTLTGCVFLQNSASLQGGGLACWDGSVPTIEECQFLGNSAHGGGGFFTDNSPAEITDCLIVENHAAWGGGGYCNLAADVVITGCTFAANDVSNGGSAMSIVNADPTLTNTIVAFNTGPNVPVYAVSGGSALLTCCDVYGNESGDYVGGLSGQLGVNGNISASPLFCDLAGGVYTVSANSPCVPPNNICDIQMGCFGADCSITGVGEEAGETLPIAYKLDQNYPNPFNPSTTISYELPDAASVTIQIYDVGGRLVRTLLDGEHKDAGRYEKMWNGTNEYGNPVATGVYYYRIHTPAFMETRSMVLLK